MVGCRKNNEGTIYPYHGESNGKKMENQMDTRVIQGFKELEFELGSIVRGLHRALNSDAKG